jgi:hypothetical protein
MMQPFRRYLGSFPVVVALALVAVWVIAGHIPRLAAADVQLRGRLISYQPIPVPGEGGT